MVDTTASSAPPAGRDEITARQCKLSKRRRCVSPPPWVAPSSAASPPRSRLVLLRHRRRPGRPQPAAHGAPLAKSPPSSAADSRTASTMARAALVSPWWLSTTPWLMRLLTRPSMSWSASVSATSSANSALGSSQVAPHHLFPSEAHAALMRDERVADRIGEVASFFTGHPHRPSVTRDERRVRLQGEDLAQPRAHRRLRGQRPIASARNGRLPRRSQAAIPPRAVIARANRAGSPISRAMASACSA